MRRTVVVRSLGGVRIRNEWVGKRGHAPGRPGRGTGRAGSPINGFSAKSRRQMRWVWNALPWEELDRLTMLTLTYPAEWRSWCPDASTLKRHLRAFRERWRRKWGAPRGTWALEFQPRENRPLEQQYAPHFHLYIGLPEGAEIEDDRTDGRPVWEWARQAWWEIVGSGDRAHRYWGVHVRACFYGPSGDGRKNAKRVGDYLWRESGKLAQKVVPEGFSNCKWWDVWGMEPVEHEQEIGDAEFVQMRRPLRRKRDEVTGVRVRARDVDGKLVPRRRELSLDGLTVTNLSDGMKFGDQLLRWAKQEVERMGKIVIASRGPVVAISWIHERWDPQEGRVTVTFYGAACRSCAASLPFTAGGEVAARRFVREHRCPQKADGSGRAA